MLNHPDIQFVHQVIALSCRQKGNGRYDFPTFADHSEQKLIMHIGALLQRHNTLNIQNKAVFFDCLVDSGYPLHLTLA